MRLYECENKKHSKSVAIECLEYVVVVGGSAVVLTMTTRYKPTCTPLSGAPRVSSEVFSIITVIMVM